MKSKIFRRYMIRELSAVFMAVGMTLLLYYPQVFTSFLEGPKDQYNSLPQNSVLLLVLMVMALPLFVYHSFTWFFHAPKIFKIKREKLTTLVLSIFTASCALLSALWAGGFL